MASCRSGSDQQIRDLPAGTYKLVVSGRAGTYAFNSMWEVPAPQSFTLAAPYSISNGVPTTGAGNLETAASIDEYTLVTTTTKTWYMDWGTCQNSFYFNWELRTEAGSKFTNGMCNDQQIKDLPAGTYKLVVSGQGGTYALNNIS
ncbi:hypothetical protein ACTMSW_00165 [Micromonospora sp. BQ11]|uniref:hypothetical protein n=1 Tax=Micromonospora sp. BQ11 TaxID=3452212 RepID=UPI003F8AF3CE